MKDLRFGEIIDEVLTQSGLTRSNVEPDILNSIKLRINQISDFITYSKKWNWRKTDFYFSTVAPVIPTSVSVVKGSRLVTLGSAVVVNNFKYGYLLINGKAFKVDPITTFTSTTFSLMANYPGDTEVSTTAKIVFPDYILNPNISSLLSLSICGKELSLVSDQKLVQSMSEVDQPRSAAMGKNTAFVLYNTGSVTLVNGNRQITGVGTAWTADMEGQVYATDEFATPYVIQSVVDGLTLQLSEEYKGPSGSGKSYKIGPKNTPLISLRNTPDDIYFIEGVGLAHSRRLVADNDISPIPNHAPLLHGSIWLALHDVKNQNPFRIQQARADFERTLKQLEETHEVIKNKAWASQGEMDTRYSGLSNFDPLEFNKGSL